ncbi:MAG: methyltransferase [archaeon]
MIILTQKEAQSILKGEKRGSAFVSLDLGKTKTEVKIENGEVFLEETKVSLKELNKAKEHTCYTVENGELKSIELFSPETNLYYKLWFEKDWPTVMLSSVPMHRWKNTTPKNHALSIVNEIHPVKGRVLDTCCGLGYTATIAAKNGAESVDTFERDENVLAIAKYNPWSSELFLGARIKIHPEDVLDGIKKFSDKTFDRIIHDPPTPSFSPELYEAKFYENLFRVLKNRGILYHYCPAPGKTKGKEFWVGVKRKLEEAGFSNVSYHERSSGIRALKK